MVRPAALLIVVVTVAGCTRSHDTAEGGFPVPLPLLMGDLDGNCKEQMEASQDGLPTGLECTGLYAASNLKSKKLAKDVETYTPAYKLWSDGAGKNRYIALPPDEPIDTSDMNSWVFPLGTKVWKEFQASEERAETRFYLKVRSDRWLKTTYVWKGDDEAKRDSVGGKTTVNGESYELPTARVCNSCHDGSKDTILGFEATSLGLPGADQDGLTLEKLVDRDLLTDPPARASYQLGDDATGKARDVFGWLHINCGTTCHNAGINSKAEETDLRMKLDVAELDGRAADQLDAYKQLVDQPAKTTQWQGMKRIVPGNPDESLVYKLITTRVGVDSNKQMPPVLSRLVDEEHAEMVRNWILALKPTEGATAAE